MTERVIVEPAKRDNVQILSNLLEKYLYEYSQWDDRGVDENGLFGYKYLESYWTDKNRFPFFIKVDGKLAGFVLVNDHADIGETDFGIAEFFVIYKYRRVGVGGEIAKQLFDRFRGWWSLSYVVENIGAEKFWVKAISEYTKGNYESLPFGKNRVVLRFSSSEGKMTEDTVKNP